MVAGQQEKMRPPLSYIPYRLPGPLCLRYLLAFSVIFPVHSFLPEHPFIYLHQPLLRCARAVERIDEVISRLQSIYAHRFVFSGGGGYLLRQHHKRAAPPQPPDHLLVLEQSQPFVKPALAQEDIPPHEKALVPEPQGIHIKTRKPGIQAQKPVRRVEPEPVAPAARPLLHRLPHMCLEGFGRKRVGVQKVEDVARAGPGSGVHLRPPPLLPATQDLRPVPARNNTGGVFAAPVSNDKLGARTYTALQILQQRPYRSGFVISWYDDTQLQAGVYAGFVVGRACYL